MIFKITLTIILVGYITFFGIILYKAIIDEDVNGKRDFIIAMTSLIISDVIGIICVWLI